MNIRESIVNKVQLLPESLLEEVNDFIDFVTNKHQSKIARSPLAVGWVEG